MEFRPVKKALIGTTIAAMALGSAMVIAQSAPQARRGTAENRLISVSLYDTGAKVVSIYGSPDEILALSESGGGATGGAGGGGGGGRGGAPGSGGAASVGTSDGLEVPNRQNSPLVGDPFGDGSEWRQAGRGGASVGPAVSADGEDTRGGGGAQGGRGGGNTGAPGGGGTATGSSGKVIYTRWVYKRNNSRYAFVMDKFNRVIQIEAIGMKNSSVKTRRGITFGSSFASLIKAYNAPDSYEVNGDNLVVRFLVRDRVAFRLSRLVKDKPQVVTGVVVAAGKT